MKREIFGKKSGLLPMGETEFVFKEQKVVSGSLTTGLPQILM